MTLERCAGCGILAKVEDGGHPFVGIMHHKDAETLGFTDGTVSARGFMPVPVCKPCQNDPAHRVMTLKCTFFPRKDAPGALHLAGMNDVFMGGL